jgi:hypothetical protein
MGKKKPLRMTLGSRRNMLACIAWNCVRGHIAVHTSAARLCKRNE